MIELATTTDNVKECRSRERVSSRRLAAAVEREKHERKRASVKYSKDIVDLKRDVDQLMVELRAEKQARAKDVNGKAAVS